MMATKNGVLLLFGILLAIYSAPSLAQTKRSSRITSSRTFGINVKSSSSSGVDFDCPEEFGYYPHPSDCTQYYVCVFGGALLESCTGGLMYSHELQTCDWPRNVGCELAEISSSSSSSSASQASRDIGPRVPQVKQQLQQAQQVPSRVRFSSIPTAGGQQQSQRTSERQQHQQHQQQHQQQQQHRQQIVQAQIQTIPPPPELRVAPNPIITSRGQPKPILDSQEDIAKLYAEAHDTLPPAEEEETDRQQRVYRGQPSTVGQVQRDRDGIIHQANANALPNHGKVGSYAFGPQTNQFSDEIYLDIDVNSLIDTADSVPLNRRRRDTGGDVHNLTDTETDSLTEDSLENSTFYAEEFGKKNDNESNGTAEFFRTPRQLRTSFTGPHSWQFQNGHLHTLQRTGPKSFKPNGHFDTFSPYLSPPAFSAVQFSKTNNNFFNKPIRPGINNFAGRLKNQPLNDFKPSSFFNFDQKPPLDEPFRPFNPFFTTTTTVPPLKSSVVIPSIIDSVRNQQIIPTSSRDIIPNNFSFFKLGSTSNRAQFSDPVRQSLPSEKVTPKNHFTSFSTIGGFFNNNNHNFSQPTNQGIPTKVPKIISHFSITPLEVSTESNYFAYNVLQNQKMKNYYATSTTTPNPTTLQHFPFVGSSNYFSKDPLEEVPHQQDKQIFKGFDRTTPRITGFYITTPSPKTTTPTRPFSSKAPLQTRPKVQGPVVGLDFDFDKFVADIRETHIAQMDPKIFEMLDLLKKKVIFNKTTTSLPRTTTERPFEHKIIPQTTPKIVTNNFFYDHLNKNLGTNVRHTTIKSSITTTAQKPPKGYDSFIKSIPQKINPVTESDQKTSQDAEQYSGEEEDEYYYDDDDDDEDYDIHPPSEKPAYMPNSETMAPKPLPITTTPRYKNHHSTFTEVTTTRRPQVFSSHYNEDKHKIPSFISFPADIFQNIAPMRPATTTTLTTTTMTATTTPSTISPYENYEISKISTTSTTPAPTAASTTRKIYTIRPNRGNLKWKLDKTTDKPNSRKRPVQQQIQVDDKYTNRVETSSQAPANIFIQQRQKPVAEQSTRNYYNTSNQSYDPYDSYYSVYDDDVDLYRDVEYTQQQQRGKPQQQSTYRPEVVTTPSPQVPVRETYVTKSQVQQIQTQQEQQYNQPSLVYNTDYEDALIAQIESDDYSQPQRNHPIRGDRIEINSITDRPIVISSTLRTSDQPKYTPATYAPTIHPKPPQQQSTSQKKSHSPKPIPTRASEQYSIVPTQQSANPQPPKQTPTRSTLSEDGINNKTTKSIIITLSASAGPKPHQPKTPPSDPEPTESLASSTPDFVSHVRNVEILKESQTKAMKPTDLTPKTVTDDENKSKIISLSTGFSTTSHLSVTNTTTKAFRDSRGRGAANREVVDQDEQKKRILSFIVSDVEPQSFQPAPRTPEITTTQRTIRVSPAAHIPEDILKGQKSIRISLTSGLGEFSSSTQSTRGRVEEVPIYTRTRGDLKRDASIEPTTYAPTRAWRLTRTSPSPFATQDTNYLADFADSREADSSFSFKRQRLNDYVSGSGSEHTPVTERGIKGDKIQSFTTRALVFKDNLSKAYDTTSSSKFVSPYKSLETILQEKESKLKLGTSKTTLKPRYTTPTASTAVVTSQKPFRSYFLITAPPKNISTSTTVRYLASPSTTKINVVPTTTSTTKTSTTTPTTTTTTSTTPRTTASTTTTTEAPTSSAPPTYRPTGKRDYEAADVSPRGRARYTYSYVNNLDDEPTTYSPKIRFTVPVKSSTELPIRRKVVRTRLSSTPSTTLSPLSIGFSRLFESRGPPRVEFAALKSEPSEIATEFRAEAQGYSEEESQEEEQGDELTDSRSLKLIDSNIFVSSSTEGRVVEITERPIQYFGKVKPPVDDANQNISKFRATVEMPEFNVPTEEEIRAYTERESLIVEEPEELEDITKLSSLILDSSTQFEPISSTTVNLTSSTAPPSTSTTSVEPSTSTNSSTTDTDTFTTTTTTTTTARTTQKTTTKYPKSLLPPRASRVNNAIKSSIAASSRSKATTALSKCADNTPNTKCNEIPSRTNTRNRGGTHYATNDREQPATANAGRGTHPPRSRPTLKPSGTIVSKAAEFVDIYKYPPFRPEPIYPTPTPDKTAAKCRKDVCLLPDCYCGGKEVPGDLPIESIPQIVLLTFDDSVNDLNKQLYTDLFEKGRVNPNGCPITATFYVSHEWTDYSQVQNLYADGHEMASHTVSHSFGEQFSQKKWTREVAGQREILAAYGGVKLADVRGMRAPFLSIGGNKMFKMLYDSNFTYDSSMPVYENRPPSWPYTLDYKIFHDCMIPPCPTKSYPGVWEVPMVMWQDLNGGRCSMGDACSNPADADGVTKMLMKNFERHYTSNRAPFGLFYHAAWFTQPHHKEGFIHFLDAINAMNDVWIVTNWQALQWVRDPTPLSRINQFQPFQCDYSDRPKRCNSPKVCNLWHKSGVRYMRTCQPCPDIYPWTGKTGIRSSRVDNDIEE